MISLAAVGILYLARGATAGWPGPRIRDALPLDELARHDAVPVLLFVGVWGSAAVLMGWLARLERISAQVAAAILGLGVGAWIYALDAVSIYVVRQVPMGDALRASAGLPAVYVPMSMDARGRARL